MDINAFKAKLQGGGARANLFRVLVAFPGYAIRGGETEEMSFLCKAAQLPASNLGVIELPYMGRVTKLDGDRTFEEWNCTIINDTDFLIRDAFERWSNGINNHTTANGLTNPNDYMSDAVIQQLSRGGDVIKEYKFEGIWPMVVTPIEVSYDATDTIEEFDVTFSVQSWHSNTTT